METLLLTEAPTHTGPIEAIRRHWREYLMEAAALGMFMISACVFGVLLEHPSSPLAQAVDNPAIRRLIGGIAMGLTAIAIICSPWGKRSGAHMNPAVTLSFLRLGKVARDDAGFYILSQFVGGIVGVLTAWLVLGDLLADSMVNFVTTTPGKWGVEVAF